MRVHLTCSACGKSFDRMPSKTPNGLGYCTQACHRKRSRAPIVIDGETARVPLLARDDSIVAYTIVDAVDAEWAGRWRWSIGGGGYARRYEKNNGRDRIFLMHRELLGLVKGDGLEGDHIDLDRLNNRRKNLRILTKPQNGQNRGSNRNSSSVYRGVSFMRTTARWRAAIRVNGKLFNLGEYADELEAANVARAARARLLPFSVD